MIVLVAHPVRQDTEDSCIGISVVFSFPQYLLQVLDDELQNVICENDKDDKIQQDTGSGEQFSGGVICKILFLEHGCGKCCHQGRKQGHDFESVQIFESTTAGRCRDLCDDGEYDEVGQSCDRQHTVEEVCAEHEKGNGHLSRNDSHLPLSTASQSVASIQESHRFVDPAVLVLEALDGTAEKDTEEDQQSAVHRTRVCQDHEVKQFEMIAFVALQTRIHRPVLRRAAVSDSWRIVDADAEADAQCRLEH